MKTKGDKSILSRKATILVLIILVLFLADYALFYRGLIWKINANPLLPMTQSRIPSVFLLNKQIYHFKHSRRNDPGTISLVALGSSIVKQGIDCDQIKTLLESECSGQEFDCYSFTHMGARCFEELHIIKQLAVAGVDVFIYGFNFKDFDTDPEKPTDTLLVGSSSFEPFRFRDLELHDIGNYVDRILDRFWILYRHRILLQEVARLEFGIALKRFTTPQASTVRTNEKKLGKGFFWENWRKSGKLSDHTLYMEKIRNSIYMNAFLRPQWEKISPRVDLNLEYVKKLSELCQEKNILFLLVHMPINPILKEHGVNITETFIAQKVEPFCAENGIAFHDFSDRMEPELFKDFNHLNGSGSKEFAVLLADTIAEELHGNGLVSISTD